MTNEKPIEYRQALVALASEYTRAAVKAMSHDEFRQCDPDAVVVKSFRLADSMMRISDRHLEKRYESAH